MQVYELTAWGYEAEEVVLSLARWALRSPTHDPTLNFSRVSLMLALRMLVVRERIGDFIATLGFRLGEEGYLAHVDAAGVRVERGDPDAGQAAFAGAPNAFLPVIFGKLPLAGAVAAGSLAVSGDRAVAERFSRLFALPAKIGTETAA